MFISLFLFCSAAAAENNKYAISFPKSIAGPIVDPLILTRPDIFCTTQEFLPKLHVAATVPNGENWFCGVGLRIESKTTTRDVTVTTIVESEILEDMFVIHISPDLCRIMCDCVEGCEPFESPPCEISFGIMYPDVYMEGEMLPELFEAELLPSPEIGENRESTEIWESTDSTEIEVPDSTPPISGVLVRPWAVGKCSTRTFSCYMDTFEVSTSDCGTEDNPCAARGSNLDVDCGDVIELQGPFGKLLYVKIVDFEPQYPGLFVDVKGWPALCPHACGPSRHCREKCEDFEEELEGTSVCACRGTSLDETCGDYCLECVDVPPSAVLGIVVPEQVVPMNVVSKKDTSNSKNESLFLPLMALMLNY